MSITIRIGDDKIQVNPNIISKSGFLVEMVEMSDGEAIDFALPPIRSVTRDSIGTIENVKLALYLTEIVENVNFDKPLKKPFNDYVKQPIIQALNIPTKQVLHLSEVLNFFNCQDAFDTCCAKLAHDLSKMSTNEIRKLICVESDFSKEEEEEIQRQNMWIEKL